MKKNIEIVGLIFSLHNIGAKLHNLSQNNEINYSQFTQILKDLDLLTEKGYFEKLAKQIGENNKWFEEYDNNNDLLHRLQSSQKLNQKILFEISQNFLFLANELEKRVNKN